VELEVMSIRRGTALILLVLSSIVLGAPPVAAAGDDKRERDARVLFERAVKSLREGQFAEARDLLNQSLILEERPATAFNLGVAYRGTGESLRAIDVLRDLLAERYGKLEPAQRREVSVMIRDVEREVANVEITAQGADKIQIRIDGRHVGDLTSGETRTFRADGGERLISAFAVDHVTVEKRVRLDRGKRSRVSFTLRPTREARVGRIVLIAPSSQDLLEIRGYPPAKGRLERDVPPGRYQVRLLSEHGSREATLTVRARSVVRHEFDSAKSSTIWQSPAFWAGTAGAVAAVTVGVILLASPGREDPIEDPEFGVVEALKRR
jgi:hypothetical protein